MQPSQGRLAWTHWSQACFDVVAREAEAEPFLREVDGSVFSFAWHLLTCLESRSLTHTPRSAAQQQTQAHRDSPARELIPAELALVWPVSSVYGAVVSKTGGGESARVGSRSTPGTTKLRLT